MVVVEITDESETTDELSSTVERDAEAEERSETFVDSVTGDELELEDALVTLFAALFAVVDEAISEVVTLGKDHSHEQTAGALFGGGPS